MSSPENALFEVLKNHFDNPDLDSPSGIGVHATVYEQIDQDKTIRVGNCESFLSRTGNNDIGEFDALVPIQIVVRVDGEDSAAFVTARDAARDLSVDVIRQLLDDETLGSKVCDLVVRKAFRGWSKIRTATYATAIVPVMINPRSYGVE